MNFQICTGIQEKAGVTKQADTILFSSQAAENADCQLLLYPRENGTVLKIPMKAQESQKTLYTVGIRGLDWEKYDYNFEIDGQEVVDRYAYKITGREIWGDERRRPILRQAKPFVPKWERKERKQTEEQEPVSCQATTEEQKEKAKIKGTFYFSEFNWNNDKLPRIKKEDMVIYKLHVRGFSMGTRANDKKRGTIDVIGEKLDQLKEMGITTLLFMPMYEFEEFLLLDQSKRQEHPKNMVNCWGYTEGNYFAPKASFLKNHDPDELKYLIKKMHRKQMECILEFYFSDKINPHFMLDIMHYWHKEYHVDGFRILGNPAWANLLAMDHVLGGCKLFFAGFPEGLAQDTERFGPKLFSYNEEFLYVVRKVLNHQGGSIYEFACQMRRQQSHQGFINYITENNGFTLWDVFSYEHKHNELNGEENQDGNDWNYSSNCGEEGVSRKRQVLEFRRRQMRNALAVLFFAQGIPMLWMGDECANSQKGNNNAYCQDNQIGWKDWKNNSLSRQITGFIKQIARLRRKYPVLRSPNPYQMTDYENLGSPDLSYHSDGGWKIDFGMNRGFIGMYYAGAYAQSKENLYIAYNFQYTSQKFALPGGMEWKLLLDTAREEAVLEEPKNLGEIWEFQVEEQSICLLLGQSITEKKKKTKGSRKKECQKKPLESTDLS